VALCLTFSLTYGAVAWNELRTTWPLYYSVPITASAAGNDGWVQDHSCTDGKDYVNRFYKPGENRAASLLFNYYNLSSGLQTCISTQHNFSSALLSPNGPN